MGSSLSANALASIARPSLSIAIDIHDARFSLYQSFKFTEMRGLYARVVEEIRSLIASRCQNSSHSLHLVSHVCKCSCSSAVLHMALASSTSNGTTPTKLHSPSQCKLTLQNCPLRTMSVWQPSR